MPSVRPPLPNEINSVAWTDHHPPLSPAADPMTTAELRLLAYLPTHLNYAEIADELFVSRHTIKTQAMSIYRKLGVTSRSPAVSTARDLGLLDHLSLVPSVSPSATKSVAENPAATVRLVPTSKDGTAANNRHDHLALTRPERAILLRLLRDVRATQTAPDPGPVRAADLLAAVPPEQINALMSKLSE
jgi:DNA-binding CsgD family transcriptional regulator